MTLASKQTVQLDFLLTTLYRMFELLHTHIYIYIILALYHNPNINAFLFFCHSPQTSSFVLAQSTFVLLSLMSARLKHMSD